MFGFLNKKPLAIKRPDEESFRRGFLSQLPDETSVEYIMDLWRKNPFSFKVAGSRKTCLGNYMYKNGRHYISVNGDSNPYSFLITLIHEIAHQHVKINHGLFKRVPEPHGNAWKLHFKTLMGPMLKESVFPNDILEVLIPHMQNPAASSTRDHALVKALARYSDNKQETGVYLADLAEGKVFNFKGRKFKKIENRRTRILAECIATRNRYTIPGIAQVEEV